MQAWDRRWNHAKQINRIKLRFRRFANRISWYLASGELGTFGARVPTKEETTFFFLFLSVAFSVFKSKYKLQFQRKEILHLFACNNELINIKIKFKMQKAKLTTASIPPHIHTICTIIHNIEAIRYCYYIPFLFSFRETKTKTKNCECAHIFSIFFFSIYRSLFATTPSTTIQFVNCHRSFGNSVWQKWKWMECLPSFASAILCME